MNNVPVDLTTPQGSRPPMDLADLPAASRVARLRRLRLLGIGVTLEPYTPTHGESLRALRNLPENRFNLAQSEELTAAQQTAWGMAYENRSDDLCWIVLDRTGRFAGATRLYDIDPHSHQAEKGGFVLHEELARAAPIALECELLLLTIAFRWLSLARVSTQVRPENTKMLSINERLGFRPAGATLLRGVPYLCHALAADEFDPARLLPILEHWKKRHAR